MRAEDLLAYRKRLKMPRSTVASDTGLSQSAIVRCETDGGTRKPGEVEQLVGYYDSFSGSAQTASEGVEESKPVEPRKPMTELHLRLAQFPRAEDKFIIEREALTPLIDLCLFADKNGYPDAMTILSEVRRALGRPAEEDDDEAIARRDEAEMGIEE